MAKRRAELVAPMIAHLHSVRKLQQILEGLAWLQCGKKRDEPGRHHLGDTRPLAAALLCGRKGYHG